MMCPCDGDCPDCLWDYEHGGEHPGYDENLAFEQIGDGR